jgi:hypothetical protein
LDHHYTAFFEMLESETDHMLDSRDNLETRSDAKVGQRSKSSEPLLAIWRIYGDAKGNLKSANFFIVVRSHDFTVVNFTAPRGACEMMISAVTTLDPRKYRRGLTPVELDTRLAGGAGYLKIAPTVQMDASF